MTLAVVLLPVVPADDDSPVGNAAGIIAGAEIEDGNEAERPTAAEYARSELLFRAPRSNATNCGACGSSARQIMEKTPTMPSAGFQTRVAAGRFLSRICASRSEASRARWTAACAIDHRRCARLFSRSETRHAAYPRGLAVSASTASSQAISRSTEIRCSIHHTAG